MILVVAAIGASRLEQQLKVGGFSLPGTEFHTAGEILADDLRISSDRSAVVVYTSPTLRVTDKEYADAVDASLARLAKLDSVTKVESFYDPGLPPFVSTNNHTTYALVTLQGSENDLQSATPEMREVAQAPPLETHLVGNAAVNFDVQEASAEDLVKVERFTFPLVAILLVLVFGSVVAASVPLLLGAVSVALALAFVYLLALVSDVSIFALNIGTMIGLGLAIDFSLIMVSRFREELRHAPLESALDRTLQTAGRSITYSGITLALTMTVLALFPVMVIRSVAVAIAVVAAVSVLTGLLLLPVVLVLLHRHLERWNLRARLPFLNRSGGTAGTTDDRAGDAAAGRKHRPRAHRPRLARAAVRLDGDPRRHGRRPAGVDGVADRRRPRPRRVRPGRALPDLRRRPGARPTAGSGRRRCSKACSISTRR